ncbi:pyridoxamine 5'-phosphate oxidase [Sphingomonas paeninsulae]|uniref:Pyridoxine/pyridoxamine 5'-phosphate oxidase n=1 Tax=Sphingomonas paeninsulae TaxID=2319844 RepID=A0A494TGA6_SPHPE|nr:pyridoxamine 5'-phosphate oxidase [Sphingomonas paeninsulae]AYJ86322.1 pyridoxamine 5'-phosphate oxidase [Sphingomonas paeninsulae]
MSTDPITLFSEWLVEAEASEPNDPNAVALATANAEGQPAVRMVLLKGHDATGFIFYTNQQSRKADDLTADPKAALLFHWKSLRRQVRVEGSVSVVDDATADAYFASRSRVSQLAAWASDQSRPLPDHGTLSARLQEVTRRFEDMDVPRPPHWSGYRVSPTSIEFWRDGAHRLHERRLFTREGDRWSEGLLYP